MKKIIPLLLVVLLAVIGIAYWRQRAVPSVRPPERKILYYVDSMHPWNKSDKPGFAPDCGMKMAPVYADEAPTAGTAPGGLHITAEKQALIGVKYGNVEMRRLTRTIRAAGKVMHDETHIARIHSKIDGWIEQVFIDFAGQFVNKGDALVSVYSPELFATQQEFLLAARAQKQLAASPYTDVAASGTSLYTAARKRLELWDVSEAQIREIENSGRPRKAVTIYAPSSGYVIARNAYAGQRITPETELYSIADHSTIWVVADLFEYEFPLVVIGQPARMTLASSPGKTFTGKVTYLYPELDPTTRTLKVRLEFPNPEHLLRPEMFANIELTVDLGRQLAVPEEAVLDSGEEHTVFVDRGNGNLEPRSVEIDDKVEGWYAVRKGLAAGDRVVTSGNFLVDSESRLKSAVNRRSTP